MLLGYKRLEHNSKDFGRVFWKSQPWPLKLHLQKYNPFHTSLYCNGFFVTGISNKKIFTLKGLNNYYPLKIPSLQIEDSHNTLPLNLQRSNIEEGITYAFEPELATAMFTDLICQLMAINIKKPKELIFIRDFYFTANGFALKNQYTHDQLRGKQIISIGVLDDSRFEFQEWKKLFDLFPDALFHFNSNSFGTVVGASGDNDKNGLRKALSFFLSRKPHVAIINPTSYQKTLIRDCRLILFDAVA